MDTDNEKPVLDPGEVITPEGEILSPEQVAEKYTRQGRHEDGKEYPNPIPMAPPIGWVPSEPIHEMIARMVLNHVKAQAEAETGEEMDTDEEADDFDVGDDYDPETPYEYEFEPQDPWPLSRAAGELERRIHEHRSKGRIETLKAELEALQTGKPWPPEAPPANPEPPAKPPEPT